MDPTCHKVSADVILYGFNESQRERRRLFVGAGEDRTELVNFIEWHGVYPSTVLTLS